MFNLFQFLMNFNLFFIILIDTFEKKTHEKKLSENYIFGYIILSIR